jgi:hypothetical protein
MKQIITMLILSAVGINTLNAQQLNIKPNYKKQRQQAKQKNNATVAVARPAGNRSFTHCGFASMMTKAKAKGFNESEYESALQRLVQHRMEMNQTAFTGTVTIPVIFHCIYRNGQPISTTTPNLTAAMYQAQINQMNADYANLSGSAYGVAADVRIQFCLAVVDTAGHLMSTPGIDRINGSTRSWSNTNTMDDATLEDYFENTIKPATIWDPYSYFNVWTAEMDQSGLLGYATFPSLSTLSGLDETETDFNAGCVINWQSIGSVAVPGQDPNYGNGRTLTHESGHFLGLRHIWGDATCGEDYCNDTPEQQDATSGCPTNDMANRCNAATPTMYQNYMDYSDDACVNTFTAQQALRCQAVMDNSPRRFSLMSSKACTARAGNAISFATAAVKAVSETGNAGACPNTKSYSFNLYVSGTATGNATVTFNLTGSTALQNIDYTISPAAVNYVANDNAAKTVTVTIYDDQAVEPAEQIMLGYTITGTGVVAGPDKQTIAINITDNDVAGIVIDNITPSPVLLNENFNATTNLPAGWASSVYDDGSSSYTPNQWVISANGGTGTSGNAAHITRTLSSKPNQYNNANISDAYLFTPLVDAAGVTNLLLSLKWRCNGEAGYDEGYIGYIPEGQAVDAINVIYFDTAFVGLSGAASSATLNLPLALSNTRFYLVFNWFNDESLGTNPPFTIDDVTVRGKRFAVASATGSDTAFVQYAGQTVNFYSSAASNNLIATITNPDQDLGCVTAAVQNAGTGRTTITTTTGSFFRSDKVISITPSTANATAHYQATLYFTPAELQTAWAESEIGTLKILKVKNGVNLSSTIDAADMELVTPTFLDATEANGYYSYKGSFTGFSQFMLVRPNVVVPVSLMNFNAAGSKNSIVLSWLTAQEINSKGFTIERCTDGVNFTSMGWVNGKVNSNITSNYTFTDNFVQPNIVYYYRLRQLDNDGRETISAVRKVSINRSGIAVTVSPMPVRNIMNVFIKGSTQAASLQLVNAQGQLVKIWNNISTSNSVYNLDVAGLTPGIYMLNVILPQEKIVKKVVIEK